MLEKQVKNRSTHNCRVRKVRKCNPGVLCNPRDVFDTIEECKDCKKQI